MPSGDTEEGKAFRRHLLVALVAFAVPAAYYFMLAQLFSLGSLTQYFLACFIPTAAFGFVLGRYASALLISFAVLVGVEVGVIVTAKYDFAVRYIDHNLIPFEFVLAPILIMPGVLLGLAARAIKSQRANSA